VTAQHNSSRQFEWCAETLQIDRSALLLQIDERFVPEVALGSGDELIGIETHNLETEVVANLTKLGRRETRSPSGVGCSSFSVFPHVEHPRTATATQAVTPARDG
jgi:hypothetical protein